MSDSVMHVINEWVDNNIHPTGYIAEDDQETARKLAEECQREILEKHPAIRASHISEAVGDLEDFMANEIERVNDAEVQRLADKDD